MSAKLTGKRVLVIGRGSGIARAISQSAREAGAQIIVASRNQQALADAYADDDAITTHAVDLTDDKSIAALADRVGPVDHVVSTASARARGTLQELERANLQLSFDTKVIGPLMLAKYFAGHINHGGSLVLFSGIHAFKPKVGYLGVGITNGAVDFLTRSLAIELAPIRVNAISPGVIDTGAWDAMGAAGKQEYFRQISQSNPARRIGTVQDIADAVLFALTNEFLTGETLKVDGGEPLT